MLNLSIRASSIYRKSKPSLPANHTKALYDGFVDGKYSLRDLYRAYLAEMRSCGFMPMYFSNWYSWHKVSQLYKRKHG